MRKLSLILILLFLSLSFGVVSANAKKYAYVHIVDYANPTPLMEIKKKIPGEGLLRWRYHKPVDLSNRL